jgi:hypothetical protein
MAENRALKRLPIAHKPHKYRIANGLTTRTFRHAHCVPMSRRLYGCENKATAFAAGPPAGLTRLCGGLVP